MQQIRAFVGHSFVEDDAAVIGKFLKYFTQVSELYPEFSWESAEAAEPKLLAEKVMALIENKNVFIGICTKRERAVEESSLSRVVLQPMYRKARATELKWKTSDWLIQEIGLAKGRALDLILFIEEGLRLPGGLQGDIEYISFSRDLPERSFGKFLEMIKALVPKTLDALATSGEQAPSAAADLTGASTSVRTHGVTPQLDWTRQDYEMAMIDKMFEDGTVGVETIKNAYLRTPESSQGDNAVSWEAFIEWARMTFGKGGSIDRLKGLATKHPHSSKVLEYLARTLARYGEHTDAARQYQIAAQNAAEAHEKARIMGLAAEQYARAGSLKTVTDIINKLKVEVAAGAIGELGLLRTLNSLAELAKDDEALIATMERIVELAPTDFRMRFSLAYKYAELSDNEMSLYHYLKIPPQERSEFTWNNIGVALDRFAVYGKAVQAYRTSKQMGNTLAMSNLARKFISVGFIQEAQAECDLALANENYHKNILHALARIRDLPDEEQKREDEVLEKSKPKVEFHRLAGRAISRGHAPSLAKRWQGPDCELELGQTGDSIRFTGTYEREDSAGLGLLLARRVTKYRVEYSGTLLGHVLHTVVARTPNVNSPAATSLLSGSADGKIKAIMVLSDDGNTIRVLENPYGAYPTYYSFGRLEAVKTEQSGGAG